MLRILVPIIYSHLQKEKQKSIKFAYVLLFFKKKTMNDETIKNKIDSLI